MHITNLSASLLSRIFGLLLVSTVCLTSTHSLRSSINYFNPHYPTFPFPSYCPCDVGRDSWRWSFVYVRKYGEDRGRCTLAVPRPCMWIALHCDRADRWCQETPSPYGWDRRCPLADSMTTKTTGFFSDQIAGFNLVPAHSPDAFTSCTIYERK